MIAFRSLPSFEECLLIDQTRMHGLHGGKIGQKHWAFAEYNEKDGVVKFEMISLEALYKHVEFEPKLNGLS